MLQIFIEKKVDLSMPVGVSCGSGVSACIVAAALQHVGITDVPLYDGRSLSTMKSAPELLSVFYVTFEKQDCCPPESLFFSCLDK